MSLSLIGSTQGQGRMCICNRIHSRSFICGVPVRKRRWTGLDGGGNVAGYTDNQIAVHCKRMKLLGGLLRLLVLVVPPPPHRRQTHTYPIQVHLAPLASGGDSPNALLCQCLPVYLQLAHACLNIAMLRAPRKSKARCTALMRGLRGCCQL